MYTHARDFLKYLRKQKHPKSGALLDMTFSIMTHCNERIDALNTPPTTQIQQYHYKIKTTKSRYDPVKVNLFYSI